MVKRFIFIIFLLGVLSGKVFSYELISGVGYTQSKYKHTNSSSPTVQLDAFVPLWFDGFKVGMGISYFSANLGSKKNLASDFGKISFVEEKDINLSLIPLYITEKYEYFFNKDFSAFITGREGLSLGTKNYYQGKTTVIENGEVITPLDTLDVWGNKMYGLSIGVSFYKKYMVSVSYDNLFIKNIYHTNIGGNNSSLSKVKTISFKLSYAFR